MDRLVERIGCIVLAATLGGSILCGPAIGQSRNVHSSLAGQLRMFQLRVVSGRLSAIGPVSHQNVTANYMGGQQRERLSIDLAGGLPTVTYERTTSEERMSFEIVGGNKVTTQIVPRSTVVRSSVMFVQPSEGSLTLTVSINNRTAAYAAPTLWHLLLLEPDVCREHLIPLLEMMRPNWQLGQQAEEIETSLVHDDSGQVVLNRGAWQQSLAALASERYVDRERAEQQLRGAGPIIVPYLRVQAKSGLDAEQLFRIRRIMRSLTTDGDEDTPDRVTPWLTGDPRIWYALLQHTNAKVRRTAATRLAELLDAAIEFDPDGTPDERQRQLAMLRERFGDTFAE
jgi:hypothetical protein